MALLLSPVAPKLWVALLVAVLGFGVSSGLAVAYTVRVDHENERRDIERSREICGLIVLADDLNQQAPIPAGSDVEKVKALRAELHRYRLALGCDQRPAR
jgi:hypothetical protein